MYKWLRKMKYLVSCSKKGEIFCMWVTKLTSEWAPGLFIILYVITNKLNSLLDLSLCPGLCPSNILGTYPSITSRCK